MQELASVLDRERVQLEFLLFKVLQLQRLLRSDDRRFLRWAAEEVCRASQRVRTTEAIRARQVNALALHAGIAAADVTLASLAERAPEPWRTIFADHSLGFRLLAGEVDDVLRVTTALARASGHAIARVLEELAAPARCVVTVPLQLPHRTASSALVLP